MFEKLYQSVNTINRHTTEPMVEERIQFLKYLEKQIDLLLYIWKKMR